MAAAFLVGVLCHAQTAYDVVAPAVKKTLEDPKGAKPHVAAFARYAGRYDNWLAGEAFVPARLNLGLSLFAAGRKDEAVKQWKTVLEISPGNRNAELYIQLVHST